MKLELEVENYIGFTDDGDVEHCVFVGIEDKPTMQTIIPLKEMIQDFIDLRKVSGKIADYHAREKTNLIFALEDALTLLKQS